MVCQSESAEGNPLCSHLPPTIVPGPEPVSEMASETSVFLPVDSFEGEENHDLLVRQGSSRRPSRNLGILVISERIPLEPDKSLEGGSCGGSVQILPYQTKSPKNDCEQGEIANEGDRKKGCCSCCRTYAGILLTLASGLVFTLGGVIVKCLQDYHPFTLAIFRFQGILLPSLVMVLYAYYVQKLPIFEPVWPLTSWPKGKRVLGLILRCAFGTTALFFHFFALQRLDVADTSVISACQPVFVTLAAYLFLGESCGIFPVFTALLTIVGVGVISRPPMLTGKDSFDEDTLIGAGFAMSGMLTATMVFVIIRYLKDVHFSVMTLVLGCWGTVQSIVCSVIAGEFKLPQTGEHWALAVALAVMTLLSQVGLTLALQCEQAGPVALVRTADCLFAFALQFIFLSTIPDLYSLTGASIIIFCVFLTGFRKWISTLQGEHPTKQKFWFLMM